MSVSRLFDLAIGALGSQELFVVALRGREAMNRPYRFDVVVEAAAHDLEAILVGEAAALTLHGEAIGRAHV